MPTAPSADPPFRRIGIVGLGLIGGSIARGVREVWPDVRITGVDLPAITRAALADRVIDDTRPAASALSEVDLIVLAAPVSAILQLLAELGRAGLPALVTDVGSTKRRIVAAADHAGVKRFLGGHPMAGAERGGLDQSRLGLFTNRPWFLMPAPAVGPADRDRLVRLVEALGARPVTIDADDHDRTVAYVSHLPQLVSTTLMIAAGEALGDARLGHAGRALDEMTRLSASSAEMWTSIFDTNRDYIEEALEALSKAAPAPGAIDAQSLRDLFSDANRWRARFDLARPGRQS